MKQRREGEAFKRIFLTTVRMSTETRQKLWMQKPVSPPPSLKASYTSSGALHFNSSFSTSSKSHSAAPQPALYMYENQQAAWHYIFDNYSSQLNYLLHLWSRQYSVKNAHLEMEEEYAAE